MDIKDFYDIAEYANTSWRGGFSTRDLVGNAYEYFVSYQDALNNGYVETGSVIDTLISNLVEDYNNDSIPEVGDWLETFAYDLGFRDFEELLREFSRGL